MSVRHFPGLQTLVRNGLWSDVASVDGWTIQHSGVFDVGPGLKGYRLLDPKDVLWASADSAEELAEALPDVVARVATKDPLVTQEMLQKVLATLAAAVISTLSKRASRTPPRTP